MLVDIKPGDLIKTTDFLGHEYTGIVMSAPFAWSGRLAVDYATTESGKADRFAYLSQITTHVSR